MSGRLRVWVEERASREKRRVRVEEGLAGKPEGASGEEKRVQVGDGEGTSSYNNYEGCILYYCYTYVIGLTRYSYPIYTQSRWQDSSVVECLLTD